MMTWTDEQIDAWCLSFHAYRENSFATANARNLQQQRCRIRQEMLRHLTAFLEGHNTLQDFTTALQPQTHPDWSLFGIHGLSGSTFLKKLVLVLLHRGELSQHLRSALLVPKNIQDAQHRMQTLHQFLESIIAVGQMSRAQLQPARVPFFLSIWWSIQDGEVWPRFTGDFRQRLLHEFRLSDPVDDQIDLYFVFRERFLILKTAFGISAWELEHFLCWQKEQEQERKKAIDPAPRERSHIPLPNATSRRLHLQWLLAKIGRKVGCQVWIARQDHEKRWEDESLGQLSIATLPSSQSVPDETVLEDVAVLWLLKNEIIAAYEIIPTDGEMITPIARLYDFGLVRAKRLTRLCLVAPQKQFEHVYRELSRPLFRQQQERHQCALMSEENLTQNGEHILRWATSPLVIEDIIASSVL